jgi:4-hydroxy-3-methylbut-2-enyl diphosphate reductase
MALKIKKAASIGFCTGVRQAIDILERVVRERGGVETLGAVVHNQQVLRRLADIGVKVVSNVDDIQGDVVVVSSHGVGPQVIEAIQSRKIKVIDTTCPFVKRAQVAAFLAGLDSSPRRLGVLSQTTQIPARFAEFAKKAIDSALVKDSELRIIDTICHDIRRRQSDTLTLARETDIVLVVGGHTSANSRHLVELCSGVTRTYLIETAAEIQTSWLQGKRRIGITSGASTDEPTIDKVLTRLKALAQD